LLSDAQMNAARAFGIAFRVDDATVQKYKEYNIDLEAASGATHHELPVPAVFIIDRNGVIRFAHWDPDYKVRMKGEEILAAAREAVGKS
jgi:peroxiredoxin